MSKDTQEIDLSDVTETVGSCIEEKLTTNITTNLASPKETEKVQCKHDLISQIVATFENQNCPEENFEQSKNSQEILKQFNNPEILTRINQDNVVDGDHCESIDNSVAVEESPLEISQESDHQCATNVLEDFNVESEVIKSVDIDETTLLLSAFGQLSKSSVLYGENDLNDNISKLREQDHTNLKKPLLKGVISKEHNATQEKEEYVSKMAKELLNVFNKDKSKCQSLDSPKKNQLCESSEISTQTNLSPIPLKTVLGDNVHLLDKLAKKNVSVPSEQQSPVSDHLEETNMSRTFLCQDSKSTDHQEKTNVSTTSLVQTNTPTKHSERSRISSEEAKYLRQSVEENTVNLVEVETLEISEAAGYVKDLIQILLPQKLGPNSIRRDIHIITCFIDIVGVLSEQLQCGAINIFSELRDLKKITSCVYENLVLLDFKKITDINVDGIDVRVFGKGLIQDLKHLKTRTSLLFREYNLFRVKFLQNSIKFSSIPFELLVGDIKYSWIVCLAKSAAKEICEEFQSKGKLEEMHNTLNAERAKLLGYVEEFNGYIEIFDQSSEEENEMP